jgi:hypothetical protein
MLLESIYNAFDRIAYNHSVFKVSFSASCAFRLLCRHVVSDTPELCRLRLLVIAT